jgi:hypothetical protein
MPLGSFDELFSLQGGSEALKDPRVQALGGAAIDFFTGNYVGAGANVVSFAGHASGNSAIAQTGDTLAGATSTGRGLTGAVGSFADAADGADIDTESASKQGQELAATADQGAAMAPQPTTADKALEGLALSDLTVEGGLSGTSGTAPGEVMNQDFGDVFEAGMRNPHGMDFSAMRGFDTMGAIDSMKQSEIAKAFGGGKASPADFVMADNAHWATRGGAGLDVGAAAQYAADPNTKMALAAETAKMKSMGEGELKDYLGVGGKAKGGGFDKFMSGGGGAAIGIAGGIAQAYADNEQQKAAMLEQQHQQGMARQAQLRSMQANYQPGMTIADLIGQGGMA